MCIAIVKPAGKWVTKATLQECFRRNPDGAGFAWHDGERVQFMKGFFKFEEFWAEYKEIVKEETLALIHFRIATKGAKDIDNCHPFALEHGVLMHNGPCINYSKCSGDKDRSDTRQFAEDFVYSLTSTQFAAIKPMIESFIGSEKIVALFDNTDIVICNEQQGWWDDGVWYSNQSYKPYTSTVTHGSAYAGGHGYSERWKRAMGGADDEFDWEGYYDGTGSTAMGGKTDDKKDEAPKTMAQILKPTDAAKMVPCVRSEELNMYVVKCFHEDGVDLYWDEVLVGYLPLSLEKVTADIDEMDGYFYDFGSTESEVRALGYFIGTKHRYEEFLRGHVAKLKEAPLLDGSSTPLVPIQAAATAH